MAQLSASCQDAPAGVHPASCRQIDLATVHSDLLSNLKRVPLDGGPTARHILGNSAFASGRRIQWSLPQIRGSANPYERKAECTVFRNSVTTVSLAEASVGLHVAAPFRRLTMTEPTKADRHGSVEEPDRSATPVRVTVDLNPSDYDALRDWAHFARMTHADVLRCLIRLLAADEQIAARVRELRKPRRKRRGASQ